MKARKRQAKRFHCTYANGRPPDPPKLKITFKHGLEIPRNWKDIIRIDTAAGNTR